MRTTDTTIRTDSLEKALAEAMRRGFTLVETEIGIHRPIDEQIRELQEFDEDLDTGYAIFGDYIVNVADAWDRNAWVMQFS